MRNVRLCGDTHTTPRQIGSRAGLLEGNWLDGWPGLGISQERKNVARIIVEPHPLVNLSDRFVKALNLLNEHGVKVRAGTQLVSRYAVIVADNPAKALEHLQEGNIAAFVER